MQEGGGGGGGAKEGNAITRQDVMNNARPLQSGGHLRKDDTGHMLPNTRPGEALSQGEEE